MLCAKLASFIFNGQIWEWYLSTHVSAWSSQPFTSRRPLKRQFRKCNHDICCKRLFTETWKCTVMACGQFCSQKRALTAVLSKNVASFQNWLVSSCDWHQCWFSLVVLFERKVGATGMLLPQTELSYCADVWQEGRVSLCEWAFTPGGEERLHIAGWLAFGWFEDLIRGLEVWSLQVTKLTKFITE